MTALRLGAHGRRRVARFAALIAFLVSACASTGATSTSSPASAAMPSATVAATQGGAPETTQPSAVWYGGTLVWAMSCPGIKPDGQSPWTGTPFATKIHELVLPPGYLISGSDPFRLLGPDGRLVAKEGDAIEVAGDIPETVSSFCSIGPQVVVRELKLAGGA